MSSLAQLLLRWAVTAIGVVIATKLIPGIHCNDGQTLFIVVLLLSFFNAILKPVLVLFTLPFIVLTMGLGIIVINALLFLFVGRLVEGFHVDGFWSAVGGAIIVSLTTMALGGFTKRAVPPSGTPAAPRERAKKDDVIDI
ncbi:MAG: phage holin family protein [Opitutus sp.]